MFFYTRELTPPHLPSMSHIGTKCFSYVKGETTTVTLIGSKRFESRKTTTQSVDGVRNGTVDPPWIDLKIFCNGTQ